jgi:hypothetical protein
MSWSWGHEGGGRRQRVLVLPTLNLEPLPAARANHFGVVIKRSPQRQRPHRALQVAEEFQGNGPAPPCPAHFEEQLGRQVCGILARQTPEVVRRLGRGGGLRQEEKSEWPLIHVRGLPQLRHRGLEPPLLPLHKARWLDAELLGGRLNGQAGRSPGPHE